MPISDILAITDSPALLMKKFLTVFYIDKYWGILIRRMERCGKTDLASAREV